MIRAFVAAVVVMVSSAVPAAAASASYGEYSLMFGRNAGQVWSGDQAASQWAWKPLGPNESEISWGSPAAWPPGGGEHFVKDGDWVLLNGYFDHTNNAFNTQRVTAEYIGDANCQNLKPIESNGGRQHYVRWTIPATGYCLKATGTITVGANGVVVRFQHDQIWSPPAPCSNQYFGAQTCIKQRERWSDDNGHPFSLSLERDQYIAKGLGMAFKIDHFFDRKWPAGHPAWHAALRYAWTW
ncbi:hypothetical protein [Actinosynnema sp. ALI-1.44]|uniref:hypothetical protein n=1 Tax=Actinosynnema sp. ALI-1.44 TaxID=1933779 RepID=UPI001875E30C|nr:hypothetical protein [Actinosynnema sp. ALI-1.44]